MVIALVICYAQFPHSRKNSSNSLLSNLGTNTCLERIRVSKSRKDFFQGCNYLGCVSSLHDYSFIIMAIIINYDYKLSPLGIGPIRSAARSCHGPVGGSVLCIGSGGEYCPTIQHPWQPLHIRSASASILGHHTLVLSVIFVLTMHWCLPLSDSTTDLLRL